MPHAAVVAVFALLVVAMRVRRFWEASDAGNPVPVAPVGDWRERTVGSPSRRMP